MLTVHWLLPWVSYLSSFRLRKYELGYVVLCLSLQGNTGCLDEHFKYSDEVLQVSVNAVEPHNHFVVKWWLARFEGLSVCVMSQEVVMHLEKSR